MISDESGVLSCFKKYGVEFYPMAHSIENLLKPKLKRILQRDCLGLHPLSIPWKGDRKHPGWRGTIFTEKARYVVPKKKEERAELDVKLKGLGNEAGLKLVEDERDYFVFEKRTWTNSVYAWINVLINIGYNGELHDERVQPESRLDWQANAGWGGRGKARFVIEGVPSAFFLHRTEVYLSLWFLGRTGNSQAHEPILLVPGTGNSKHRLI